MVVPVSNLPWRRTFIQVDVDYAGLWREVDLTFESFFHVPCVVWKSICDVLVDRGTVLSTQDMWKTCRGGPVWPLCGDDAALKDFVGYGDTFAFAFGVTLDAL